MKKTFLFILFLLFISFSPKVFASTLVDSDITQNTIWTADQSPYVVNTPIGIATGVTLTINPGVIVKFDYGASMLSDGTINALGTADNPIYFTSLYDDSIGGDTDGDNGDVAPSSGDWDDIFIEGNTQSTFNHIILRYSTDGLFLYQGASVTSDSYDSDQGIEAIGSRSSFTNLTVSSIEIWSGSDFSIDTATISNFGDYRWYENSAINVYDESSLTLKNSTVSASNDSIINIYQNSSVVFDAVNVGGVGDDFYRDGIDIFENGSLAADKVSVSNVGDGLNVYDNSSVTISNFSMMAKEAGISIYDDSSLNFSKGSVSGGDYGIYLFDEANAKIDKIKVSGASQAGIIAFQNYLPNPISITKSEITGNSDGFVVFDTAISAHQNNIHDNTDDGAMAFSPLDPNQFDFSNNYWGDPTGPSHPSNPEGLGNAVTDDVLFTPWLASDPLISSGCATDCFFNVLFLPGLEASRLYLQTPDKCPFNCEDQLWEPNWNSDAEDLYMNSDGASIKSGIYTRDIIKTSNIPISIGLGENIYKSFSDTMDKLVSDKKITEWKAFPYDWRESVEYVVEKPVDIGGGMTDSLLADLKVLIKSSKNGKVTIVAHSNGGLVAKALLVKLQEMKSANPSDDMIDHIDRLILVAVPQIGTASAVPAMLHGFDQQIADGWILDDLHARELGRNMPAAYGLLPSEEYINHMSASPVAFADNPIPSGVTTNFIKSYGNVIDSYPEYKSFLFGSEGRAQPAVTDIISPIKLSPTLFAGAETLHNALDEWVPPQSLRVIEIAGWGLDTVASFQYYPKYDCNSDSQGVGGCAYILDERPIFTADGDNTVVSPSALWMGGERWWVNLLKVNNSKFIFETKDEHKNILEVPQLIDLISNTIQDINPTYSVYMSTTTPIDTTNRLRLSVLSPVTIDAYDAQGNHTGKICPATTDLCYVEENIPNSSYYEFGEGKYLNLPQGIIQKVDLQGTDSGTFTFNMQTVTTNGNATTSSFTDIPVTTQTEAEITIDQKTGTPQMALDVTGDGKTDFNLTPSAAFDPVTYLQIMRATIDSLDLTKQQIKDFDTRVDNIIKSIQKGKVKQINLKVDKFKNVLEHKLSKPDPKKPRPKKLSKTDAQTLLDMLNTLLDNIN